MQANLRSQFHHDGFAIINGLIDTSEIEDLREIGHRLLGSRTGYAEGLMFDFYPESNGCDSEHQLLQLHWASYFERRLSKLRIRRAALDIAKALLGSNVRFAGDSFFLKQSHTDTVTPWHQDDAFTDARIDHREVNFWIPLQAVSVDNGCMQFIPGSHLYDVLPHVPLGGDVTAHGLECVGGFDPARAVACPLMPGDCTVHAGRTLHAAGANFSDQPRYAYALNFRLPRRRSSMATNFPWHNTWRPSRIERSRASRSLRGCCSYLRRELYTFDFRNPFEWQLAGGRIARWLNVSRQRMHEPEPE
ncbi:phytanoyl-CoA dioxygenase family protein [Burkholderia sp. HI2761]|uniref:phytanoyl-CoA dioxygenase family protein n=1 Tax=Burkholderia TaxID=32008 RepID=UPI00041234EE|nr:MULTISPECIES: phytanoyl-CoA dioxygenase family protein [Burkholderia]MPV57399.1 phytanoyl-CoA dioxygenase family protein [Burkholderia sp. BE24]OXJ22322.1 phytanoyl-CoA dioxygenase family protein [Burkholderia sp. HI2761]